MRTIFNICVCVAAGHAMGFVAQAAPTAKAPQRHKQAAPVGIPKVRLSKQDEAQCRVRVGDAMPAIILPQIGGRATKLSALLGKKATVVLFWKSDRRMSQQALADMGPDVVEPFGSKGVAVVGIAVKESDGAAQAMLKKTGATFPNLLDADGKAFAQVGSGKLPRTYLLDPRGKILWFDIEYSLTTRRELKQALQFITGDAAAASN